MADVNRFRKRTIDGVTTYFYNGKKISKEEFDKQRAAAKQRQTDILGISKEDFKKETREERKKRMMAELNKLSKGGLAGRLAKRGYGLARK